MAKVIVLGAMKGGVGKSVSTYNLAYSLKKLGKNVLVVDFDSSANITRCVVEDNTKSWTAKKVRETSQTLTMVVHSKNRYQLAHLLEYGHAKRNGGRVEGKAHIAPAEQHGIRQLQEEIERVLRG